MEPPHASLTRSHSAISAEFHFPIGTVYATAFQCIQRMRQLRNAREGRWKIAPHHSRPVTISMGRFRIYEPHAALRMYALRSSFATCRVGSFSRTDINFNSRSYLERKAHSEHCDFYDAIRCDHCGYGPFCQMSNVTAELFNMPKCVSPSDATSTPVPTRCGSSTGTTRIVRLQDGSSWGVSGNRCRTEHYQ